MPTPAQLPLRTDNVKYSTRRAGGGIASSDLDHDAADFYHDAAPVAGAVDTDTNADFSTDGGRYRRDFRPSRLVVNSTRHAGGGIASCDLDHDAAPVGTDADTDTNADVRSDGELQRSVYARLVVDSTRHAADASQATTLITTLRRRERRWRTPPHDLRPSRWSLTPRVMRAEASQASTIITTLPR